MAPSLVRLAHASRYGCCSGCSRFRTWPVAAGGAGHIAAAVTLAAIVNTAAATAAITVALLTAVTAVVVVAAATAAITVALLTPVATTVATAPVTSTATTASRRS